MTNPNSQFNSISIDCYLFCFVVHTNGTLHIFIKLILRESQQYTKKKKHSYDVITAFMNA